MPEHSPEPWTADPECGVLRDANGAAIELSLSWPHILKCVNAFAGLNPEAVRELIGAVAEYDKKPCRPSWNEVMAALEKVRGK